MDNYILEYYQAIVEGKVTVGKWIREWYKLLIAGLQEKRWFFDQKKAMKAVNFIERFCRHHEGALAPQLIKLELWQKAFVSTIFGVVDKEGNRQFREILLVVARKNGKTLLAAGIVLYLLFVDGEYGARIYFCAPKLDQARLCYDAMYQMILKEPTMSECTRKRRSDIYIAETNSSAMPLAFSARKSDGLNISGCVCDELAAWRGEQGRRQYEVLKSSQGSRKQPLIINITTANFENDGIHDEMMKRATAVINGDSRENRLAPFLYQIDDIDKWNDINELQKSNPNMGVSISVDYLLEEIAIAEGSLSKRSEFLCKMCNIKQSSSQAWLSTKDIDKGFHDFIPLEDQKSKYCIAGIDLSNTTDLTACVLVIQRGDKLYYYTKFFMPKEKVDEATARDGLPYRQYITQGYLVESGDNFVDYHDCFNWFKKMVEEYEILPLAVGYDRYSAQYLVQQMEGYGFKMESVFQGGNLTGVINTVEGMIRDGTLVSGEENNLMKTHLLNSALKLETETNRKKLIKLKPTAHVDGMAALLDAMCMRAVHWEELSSQLAND